MDGATAGHDDPRHLLERLEEALTTAAGPTDGSTDDSSRPARRARCARPGLARHVTIGLVRFVSWLAVNAVALAVVLWLIPGIHLDGPTHGSAEIRHKLVPLLIVALILGTVSRFVKPVLTILSLPLIIVTLGLFLLVVNAAMLGLTAWILGPTSVGFHVDGFWPAAWGGVIFALAGFFARKLLTDDERR